MIFSIKVTESKLTNKHKAVLKDIVDNIEISLENDCQDVFYVLTYINEKIKNMMSEIYD